MLVGKKIEKYIGEPLEAFVYHGKAGWGGRSNIFCNTNEEKKEIQLADLNDCFSWIKKWSSSEKLPYFYGYVLDYKNKTIYYDKIESLNWLLKNFFPAQETENYFITFVQKDFSV